MFYRLVRWASIPLFRLYFRLEGTGLENVPANGPLIVAANHVSYLDPAVLGSLFPRQVHFLMDARTWAFAPLNWFYRGMEAIPVDRSGGPARAALRAALTRLASGSVVGIFPEGARTLGALEEGLPGVALLSRRSGAPVLPVGIWGTHASMPKGTPVPLPSVVRLAFGAPLSHADVARAASLAGRAADSRFTGEVMARVGELVTLAAQPVQAVP